MNEVLILFGGNRIFTKDIRGYGPVHYADRDCLSIMWRDGSETQHPVDDVDETIKTLDDIFEIEVPNGDEKKNS